MKLVIRRQELLVTSADDYSGGWTKVWRAVIDDPSWLGNVIVGDYNSQPEALTAGCIAYKFINTAQPGLLT